MIKTLSVAALTALTISSAFTQAAPTAPTNVCISDDTGPSSCSKLPPTTTGQMKWNPGHYVRADVQGFESDQTTRFWVHDQIKNEPLIKGSAMIMNWGAIENERDKYDWSLIDEELAHLKSMNKRLIVDVWFHQFGGGKTLTQIPQTEDRRYFGDYMIREGGVGISNVDYGGFVARIHDPKWMDRLIKLFQEMGARYDKDPYFEQVIISETSMTLTDPTFSQQAVITQLKRLLPAVRAAWPTTPVVLYLNYLGSEAETRDMVAYAHSVGVGIGGPDIIPPPPDGPYEDWGSQALRGSGGNFGTVDYRGTIPISYSYEIPSYGGYNFTGDGLLRYANGTLKATHVAWTYFNDKIPQHNWTTGILPAIKAKNGAIVTACPSTLKCAQ